MSEGNQRAPEARMLDFARKRMAMDGYRPSEPPSDSEPLPFDADYAPPPSVDWSPVERPPEGVNPPILTGGSGFGSDHGFGLPADPLLALSAPPAFASDVPYAQSLSCAKWDWYQTSVWVSDPQVSGLVDVLLRAWPMSDWEPARPLNLVYQYGGAIMRGQVELCRLSWGGQPGVNCKTSSSESGTLQRAIARFGQPHAPTRLDACVDWVEPGLFESVSNALRQFALGKRLSISMMGDWERNEGRSLYLGGKTSIVQVCLYEKGAEQRAKGASGAPKDWVRLEVRLGNMKRKDRDKLADWADPAQVFGVGWMADACKAIGFEELKQHALGTVWRRSDEERAFHALVHQYGPLLKRMAQGSSEGWDGPIQRLMKALDPYGEVASYSGERVLRDRQTDELNAASEAATRYRETVARLVPE
jgi:hypothetical protein